MDKPMPSFMFYAMSSMFKLRDLLAPREGILKEVSIKPGFQVLDYGCGPGAYLVDVAERVGESGRVYALDLHPLAIQRVQSLARRRKLTNVGTICSDCQTGLPDQSVDVVLLYDIFHGLSEPHAVLAELHRVLKQNGTLSFMDPHMNEDKIISSVTDGRLFRLVRKGEKTCTFSRQAKQE